MGVLQFYLHPHEAIWSIFIYNKGANPLLLDTLEPEVLIFTSSFNIFNSVIWVGMMLVWTTQYISVNRSSYKQDTPYYYQYVVISDDCMAASQPMAMQYTLDCGHWQLSFRCQGEAGEFSTEQISGQRQAGSATDYQTREKCWRVLHEMKNDLAIRVCEAGVSILGWLVMRSSWENRWLELAHR